MVTTPGFIASGPCDYAYFISVFPAVELDAADSGALNRTGRVLIAAHVVQRRFSRAAGAAEGESGCDSSTASGANPGTFGITGSLCYGRLCSGDILVGGGCVGVGGIGIQSCCRGIMQNDTRICKRSGVGPYEVTRIFLEDDAVEGDALPATIVLRLEYAKYEENVEVIGEFAFGDELGAFLELAFGGAVELIRKRALVDDAVVVARSCDGCGRCGIIDLLVEALLYELFLDGEHTGCHGNDLGVLDRNSRVRLSDGVHAVFRLTGISLDELFAFDGANETGIRDLTANCDELTGGKLGILDGTISGNG